MAPELLVLVTLLPEMLQLLRRIAGPAVFVVSDKSDAEAMGVIRIGADASRNLGVNQTPYRIMQKILILRPHCR